MLQELTVSRFALEWCVLHVAPLMVFFFRNLAQSLGYWTQSYFRAHFLGTQCLGPRQCKPAIGKSLVGCTFHLGWLHFLLLKGYTLEVDDQFHRLCFRSGQ